MNIFLGTIGRFSKPVVMMVSFMLFALILVAVNTIFKPDFKYLTQTFGYSPEKAYQMMNAYGEAGRLIHLRVLIADVAMVLLYTVFFSTTIYSTFSKVLNNTAIIFVICLIPFVLAITQLMEVLGVFTLLTHYQDKMFMLTRTVSNITMIKFILTYICFLLPVAGFVGMIIKKMAVKS